MLIIRSEQLEILNRPFVLRFRRDLDRFMQSDFPDEYAALGPEGVQRLIEHAIQKARQYNVEFESDICDLFSVMVRFGINVDQQAWAAPILQNSAEPIKVRISQLLGWANALHPYRANL